MYFEKKLQQGVRFDPDMPQTIRLEFAKSNTKGKTNRVEKREYRNCLEGIGIKGTLNFGFSVRQCQHLQQTTYFSLLCAPAAEYRTRKNVFRKKVSLENKKK